MTSRHPLFTIKLAHLAFVAVGTALLGLGCSANSTDDALTRSEFCRKWSRASCRDEVVSVCQAPSEQACEEAQRRECSRRLPEEFVDRGVGDCLEAVSGAYRDADLTAEELDVVMRYGAPCDSIFLGGDSGDSCSSDSDCEPALRCVFKDGTLGTCQDPVVVEAGFPCREPDASCEAGFYCDGRNCIAVLEEGDACENDAQCGADRFCDGACVETLSRGAPCTSDSSCATGICYTARGGGSTCLDRLRLSPAEPLCEAFR